MKELLKKMVAELIGTAALTFAACGVAVVTGANTVATSLAFGLVIVAMAYSIGHVSGCHINPAVSLAMWMRKEISGKEFLAYVGAQVVGAFVGSVLLALCLRGNFESLGGNAIQPLLQNGGNLDAWSYIGAFLAEVVLTCFFLLAILGATDSRHDHSKAAGLIIGGALTLVHLLGLSLTGTSVNPARSLAPAVLQAIAGNTTSITQIWIWLLAPMAGAALAVLLYNLIAGKKEPKLEA